MPAIVVDNTIFFQLGNLIEESPAAKISFKLVWTSQLWLKNSIKFMGELN